MKVAMAGMCAIAILSLFCLLYTYDGIHIKSGTSATDYIWEPNQLKTTMKEGFAWLKMDKNGYNNVYDYSEQPDILLMGSSHMEALQVDKHENTGYLLNELLPQYHTYNIGMSGHTIYRCMDNLENALESHQPQKYVVMVIDTVDLDIDSMNEVLEGTARSIPSYDSGIIYYLQKIPAIKVIYKQLDDWMSLDSGLDSFIVNAESKQSEENYDFVLNEFLERAANISKEAGVELILVYQPTQTLNADGTLQYGYSQENRDKFVSLCEEKGISFLNMTEAFDILYEKEHILAHGFSNSEIGEGHLNRYGHAVIAEIIANKIQELEAQ